MFAILLALVGFAVPVKQPDLVVQSLFIPAPGAEDKGLQAVLVRPDEPGAHPLALITHGTPRDAVMRRQMTPWDMLPQAEEFARRGWAAVVVMRRGYGNSGGSYAEGDRACAANPRYYASGVESANDLRAAIAYLSGLPEVDPTRIISVGWSAGGFATVALTADPPPGLVAGISFAGGRGSPARDEVCNSGDLVRAFGSFGEHSHVPMLWIYARNDHFFTPEMAGAFYHAFTDAGGSAQLVSAGSFGADGHTLFFSRAGIPIWGPMVDDFLQSRHLTARRSWLADGGRLSLAQMITAGWRGEGPRVGN